MSIKKIVLHSGAKYGGNSLEDLKGSLAASYASIEMDFQVGSRGRLLSGLDPDAYFASTGRMIDEIDRLADATNAKGGRCVKLGDALRLMPLGSRLYVDLKNTSEPSLARTAMRRACSVVAGSGAAERAIVMAYGDTVRKYAADYPEVATCVKWKGPAFRGPEDEAMPLLEEAVRSGATSICVPVPASFKRLARACVECGVELLVPIWNYDKGPEILRHLENGTRSFICLYRDKRLAGLWAEFEGRAPS